MDCWGGGVVLVLCAAVWRLMPKLWRRLNWASQAALSLLVLLALMCVTAWMPGGLEQGLNLFGQPTSIVLALVTAVVVGLSGIFLARLHFVPLAGKIVAGLLAAYGVAAFLLAVNAGTPYPSLFHGGKSMDATSILATGRYRRRPLPGSSCAAAGNCYWSSANHPRQDFRLCFQGDRSWHEPGDHCRRGSNAEIRPWGGDWF